MSAHFSSQLPTPTGALLVPQIPLASVALSLVIPTYNEGKNIQEMIQQLQQLLDPILPNHYELIVVDDDSPDRTWELALAMVAICPQVRVIRRQGERGLSTAVIRGWQAAQGEILGVMDGDLQHPPEVLLKLLWAIDQGSDLSVASRHVEGGGISDWGLIRRCLSRGAQLLGLMILPNVIGRVSDPMSGYFLVRRSAIAEREMNPYGYKILIEVLGRGEVDQVAEVGYVFQERRSGESKVTWRQYMEYLLHLAKLRSRGRISRLRKHLQFPLSRFLRFGFVGCSGFLVDMAVFYLLRTQFDLGIIRSTLLSAEVAVVNNFLWNDRWTFGDIARGQPRQRQRLKRFFKFNLVCLAGIVFQALLTSAMHDWLHMNEFIAKPIAIGVVLFWNFWINLKLSWRVTDTGKDHL